MVKCTCDNKCSWEIYFYFYITRFFRLQLLVINPYLKPPYTDLHNAYEQMRLAEEEREREVEEFRKGGPVEEEPVPTKKRPGRSSPDTDKKKPTR